MKTIYANIWGAQKKVHLGTWAEIRKRGFKPHHRAFGALNDNTPALFFFTGTFVWNGRICYERWYVTTQTLEQINQLEHEYQQSDHSGNIPERERR